MKKLGQYIASLLLISILSLYGLDYIFTKSYYDGVPRTKISWVQSQSFPDSLDYVLLGSSRCINHLQPELITKTTNKKGLNLGYASSGPVEIKLMLHEVIRNSNVKKVFIQVDYIFNQTQPDVLAIIGWLPFIKEKKVYSELIKYDDKYTLFKLIPFYRYQLFDPKIGIRNVSLIYLGKQGDFISSKGYIPINRTLKKDTIFNKVINDKENKIFNEIIEICLKNDIELHFFTSPIYNNRSDFGTLNKYLPNFKDFSNSISERNLFSDATHLNHQGASLFTEIFIETYFKQTNPQ